MQSARLDEVLTKLVLISRWSVGCLALSCKALDGLHFPRLGETLFLQSLSMPEEIGGKITPRKNGARSNSNRAIFTEGLNTC